jgi:hypothetical protein
MCGGSCSPDTLFVAGAGARTKPRKAFPGSVRAQFPAAVKRVRATPTRAHSIRINKLQKI